METGEFWPWPPPKRADERERKEQDLVTMLTPLLAPSRPHSGNDRLARTGVERCTPGVWVCVGPSGYAQLRLTF